MTDREPSSYLSQITALEVGGRGRSSDPVNAQQWRDEILIPSMERGLGFTRPRIQVVFIIGMPGSGKSKFLREQVPEIVSHFGIKRNEYSVISFDRDGRDVAKGLGIVGTNQRDVRPAGEYEIMTDQQTLTMIREVANPGIKIIFCDTVLVTRVKTEEGYIGEDVGASPLYVLTDQQVRDDYHQRFVVDDDRNEEAFLRVDTHILGLTAGRRALRQAVASLRNDLKTAADPGEALRRVRKYRMVKGFDPTIFSEWQRLQEATKEGARPASRQRLFDDLERTISSSPTLSIRRQQLFGNRPPLDGFEREYRNEVTMLTALKESLIGNPHASQSRIFLGENDPPAESLYVA